MRIVGGRLSGRRFDPPKGSKTRPTTDRVREAVGSLLEARDRLTGSRVLDLFAGSGAYGFEMLSRGARSAVAVERDRRAVQAIRQSATSLGLTLQVLGLDLIRGPERAAEQLAPRGPFDLVLADPPYAEVASIEPLLAALLASRALTERATLVIEHRSSEPPPSIGGFRVEGAYRYGDSAIQLLSREPL